MRTVRHAVEGLVVMALLVTPAFGVTPTEKCVQGKLRASGKKLAGKMVCHARAKARSVGVDAGCLTKAEAKFGAAVAKADGGGCPGTTAALETAVDDCVGALLPLVPGDGTCPGASAKAAGKYGSILLTCQAGEVTKPGSFGACDGKGQAKLMVALGRSGGCAAPGGIVAAVHQCLSDIEVVIEPPPTTTTSTSSTTSTTLEPCGSTYPACNGSCAAGTACASNGGASCECVPPGTCSDGTCLGSECPCPAGYDCISIPGGSPPFCYGPPCGADCSCPSGGGCVIF